MRQQHYQQLQMASFRNKIAIYKLQRILFIRYPSILHDVLIYKTNATAVKSLFNLIALLTLITGATSFQTTLAQPLIGDNNMAGTGSGGGAGIDFNPMSFANNMFNASSLFGSVGISMVDGVKVTSINLLGNNEIAVTLRHSTAVDTANNVNANTTISTAPVPPRVTVTAIRAPLNLKDVMSLASQSSKVMAANNNTSNTMSNPMMMDGPLQRFGGAADNGTNNVNPLSFLTDLQIGSSSTIANADWSSPQIVRMGLTGMMGGTNNNRSTTSTADFIIVSVIPYTGKSTTTGPAG